MDGQKLGVREHPVPAQTPWTDPGAGWPSGWSPFQGSGTPAGNKAYKSWRTHKEQRTHTKPGHGSKRDLNTLQPVTDLQTGPPGAASCRRAAGLLCVSRAEAGAAGARWEPAAGTGGCWRLIPPLRAEPAQPRWVRRRYSRLGRKQGVSRQMGFERKELTLPSPL